MPLPQVTACWAEDCDKIILRHCPVCKRDSIVGHVRRSEQAHGAAAEQLIRPTLSKRHATPFVDKLKHVGALYVCMRHIGKGQVGGELKKGSAELLILSLIEHRPRHGYEIGKLIETRSAGVLRFNVASLYPLLYRLEQRGLIKGQWVETPGQRRRRFYQLTAQGRKMLKHQQGMWREFVNAMELITGAENA